MLPPHQKLGARLHSIPIGLLCRDEMILCRPVGPPTENGLGIFVADRRPISRGDVSQIFAF